MSKITMELECGCFQRSGYDSIQEFRSKEDARERAHEMAEDMNESFCGAHTFSVTEINGDFKIAVKSIF